MTCRFRQPDPRHQQSNDYYSPVAAIVCLRDLEFILEHNPEATVCDRHEFYVEEREK